MRYFQSFFAEILGIPYTVSVVVVWVLEKYVSEHFQVLETTFLFFSKNFHTL